MGGAVKYIAIDTETTGLSEEDRVVELACVTILNDDIQQEEFLHCYINPEWGIPAAISKLHGVTNDHVVDAPSFSVIADDFLNIIDGATLVIHNAPFDLRCLVRELAKAGAKNIYDVPVIDIRTIALKAFPDELTNTHALSERLGIEEEEPSTALTDAVKLARIWLKMKALTPFDIQPVLAKKLLPSI